MEKVRSYKYGLLYQHIAQIEDSFDIEGMGEGARAHAALSLRLDKAMKGLLPGGYWHLSCGGCHICERCAKRDELPCRHPELALPSMEGSCIDVYKTCSGTPLKYINGQNTVTFFGLVLFSEG